MYHCRVNFRLKFNVLNIQLYIVHILTLVVVNYSMGKRLNCVEELAKAANKKLTQGMAEHSKAMSTAKSDEEKANIVRSLACVI